MLQLMKASKSKTLSLAHRIIMFIFLKAFICLANGTKCKLWPICYADMFADILIHAIYGIYVYADIFADILIHAIYGIYVYLLIS